MIKKIREICENSDSVVFNVIGVVKAVGSDLLMISKKLDSKDNIILPLK